MTITEYGIWCAEDGGFTVKQIYSVAEGEKEIVELVAANPDAADYTLTITPVCPDHEEQPKDGCEECYAEELEDEDDPA